jgi:hypothetical protein
MEESESVDEWLNEWERMLQQEWKSEWVDDLATKWGGAHFGVWMDEIAIDQMREWLSMGEYILDCD